MLANRYAKPTRAYGISEAIKLEEKKSYILRFPGYGYFLPNTNRYDRLPSTYHSEYVEKRIQYLIEI